MTSKPLSQEAFELLETADVRKAESRSRRNLEAALESGFSVVVWAPPGSGKTELFLKIVRNALMHEASLARAVNDAGLTIEVDDFVRIIGDAIRELQRPTPWDRMGLTSPELDELAEGGISDDELLHDPSNAIARTVTQFSALVASALSVPEAAAALGVDESRIRQRLGRRTLFGVKQGRSWSLPEFQFVKDSRGRTKGKRLRVVTGFDEVLPAVPPSLHPVAVWQWFSTPTPDLEVKELPVSPIEWLRTGGSVDRVVAIAADL